MKKIEIEKDLFEYKFKSAYVKNRIRPQDRKCTKLFTWFYNFLNKTKLLKLFLKNRKIKFLHESTFSNYQKEHKSYKKDVEFDLKLEKLYIYDILPKEKLPEFENKFKKFRGICAKNMFMSAGFQLQERFDHLKNAKTKSCGILCDHLKLSKKLNSFRYFDYLTIHLIGITDSFFTVKYELTPNEYTNLIIKNILEEDVYESPTIYTNNKWWKLGDIGGSSGCDNRAKKNTVQNFMLEIKYEFMKDVKKYLLSFMQDNKLTPAGMEILSTSNFEKVQEIAKFFEIYNNSYQHKKEKIIFSLADNTSEWNPNYVLDSIVIVDSNDKEKNGEHKWFPEIHYNLSQKFASYSTIMAINKDVSTKINNANIEVNKSINKGKKILTLMKLNRKIDKDLFFYKRLMREIEFTEEGLNSKLNEILKNYKIDEKNPSIELIRYYYLSCFYDLKANKKLLNNIYDFFTDNINSISNYSTMKNISWTLFVTILALIVSIIGLLINNNCEIMKQILDFFKSLFS